MARCFTGWTIKEPYRGAGFEFNPRMHDPGEKTVLGVKIPAGGGIEDGLRVLDIVTHHPATAHHISFELAQRFVADNPPPALVDAMARTFQRTSGDLREVMKTMLTSREFWSQGAYRAKVKSPLEMVASALRATGADVTIAFGVANKIGDMGEPLYRKVEPTGYSNAGAEWMNSAVAPGAYELRASPHQEQAARSQGRSTNARRYARRPRPGISIYHSLTANPPGNRREQRTRVGSRPDSRFT